MAAVEFFSNCCGVEPRLYTKYIKRKPQRQYARTVKQERSQSQFDDDILRAGSVDKSQSHHQSIKKDSSLYSKTAPEQLDLLNEQDRFADEPGGNIQETDQPGKKVSFGSGTTLEDSDEDEVSEDDEQGPPVTWVNWMSLAMIFMIQLGNHWQRSLPGYSFPFFGTGEKAGNPRYELRSAIPEMHYIYGLLVGVIFMLPFAVLGIYTGQLVDSVSSRKNMFGAASILWSSTTLVQALFPNIVVFSVMRFTLAIFQSTGNPLMYSLLRDLFPPSKRVLTTSIVGSSVNLGVALSSLSLLIIDTFGWKVSYFVTASYGIFVGIVGVLVLREPTRGQFDKKKKEEDEAAEPELGQLKNQNKESFFAKLRDSFLGIIRQPCARWILCAGFFRFFGGYAFIYFNPNFFTSNFPEYVDQFSVVNAALTASLSFISGMVGGYVGNSVRQHDPRTKSYLCSFASFASAPFLFFAYFVSKDFWFSMTMVGFSYLVGEGWSSSCFTMLLDVTDAKTQGLTINVFFLVCMCAAMISTAVCDALGNSLGAEENPAVNGYILGTIMMISLIGSGTAFFISGIHYKRFMDGGVQSKE